MQIILLTHSREVLKKTNTGQLVEQVLPATRKIIWQRTEPDNYLLSLIASNNTALLYPYDKSCAEKKLCDHFSPTDFDNLILIDSTWQEARKIYNRSPYLQALPRVQLSTDNTSNYSLRRNQLEGGLCTAECVIELLRQSKQTELAEALNLNFTNFINSAK